MLRPAVPILAVAERAGSASVKAPGGPALAVGVALDAGSPNFATGGGTAPFLLAEATHVRLPVFDALADASRQAGPHAISLAGSNLPSRAYFYRLDVGCAAPSQARSLTILR